MADRGRRDAVVVVGAGLAGAKAVEGLRDQGFDGPVTLVGSERHLPYERPPLTKDHLFGTVSDDVLFVHDEPWYAERDVDVLLGTTAVELDRHVREVVTAGGRRLPYGHVLLATGSSPRLLSVPGSDLDGVLYLRTLDDNQRVKACLVPGARLVVIGGGWIGMETAAAARRLGAEVTVLEAGDVPLGRVLGPKIGEAFADLHREHGVDVRRRVQVDRIDGDGEGHVRAVVLRDGTRLRADVVVGGIGVVPNDGLARAAGLAVDNGVLVDEHLRTTDPRVLAAGDVANALHPLLGRHVRVEHWANALNQPAVAAGTIIGADVVYDRLPYFYTDQFELGMEYVGYVPADTHASVVVRGDLAGRKFVAFWVAHSRVLAGMNVNVWDVGDDVQRLVLSGVAVDAHALADPEVPLEALLPSS
ncbi:MAG: NAD(P)/FAD-dependent oxidoreductase [Actinomycetes bacterium]